MKKYLSYIVLSLWVFLAGFITATVKHHKPITDYQINLHNDTLFLYDGSRLVGTHIDNGRGALQHGAFIDSVITNDNK